MLLLFFPEFSIMFTHFSLFIPMLSPIILYYFSNLIVSLVKLHMAPDKSVHFSVIKIDKKLHCCFHMHRQLNVNLTDFITFTHFSSQ